ncbi:Brf1-like TBP-binding domain-containing protein [Immersiella caudata]|uniref:Brf1-like TBP-binding domain-containing protein n=1 Tax=Immersiella caudata TaxID=314043 RepID=A0AA39WR76_9PEZI|nr:Brf1-like TBP-binding domain-containing protein [Immersiella caudata]
MAPTIKVPVRVGGTPGKPKPKKPNAVRRIMEREESRERRVRESSATVSSAANQPGLATTGRRLQCPNKTCKNPKVRNGTCESCGAVAEENNIVADITFGEASNGAAVVQGNFLAADQGAVRTSGGYAFRRIAGSGSEARERSIREVKGLLQQWTTQLSISIGLVDSGLRIYKMASNSNFVQGRRKINVAAICLYAVCRKEANNRVMLIDLADIIKTDVFLLGRDYKNLLSQFPDMREGTKPIILEDLIFRFASKLEFYHDTPKVAESAVRIAARMQKDNMTHGRRPAGICGAAVIMAARAHNYRRTVREVVYIAKVTMATLQERMEEFANVPSAQMTISEFHEQDFLESTFDPPFVYKQTKEWKEKHPGHRKRKVQEISRDAPASSVTQGGVSAPSAAPVIDKDGFVVPPLPQRAAEPAGDSASDAHELSTIATATAEVNDQLEALASEYGDSDSEDSELDPNSEMAMAAAQGIVPIPSKKPVRQETGASADASNDAAGAKKKKKTMVIDEAWELEEASLEEEMEGHLLDPTMIGASNAIKKAVEDQRAKESAAEATGSSFSSAARTTSATTGANSTSTVSDDPIIHEDEFKDDPEVMYCKLGEEEVKIKEMIWANHNKDYMRMQQKKIFESKMSENGPPKQRRNRAKKARIGEGQASPAQSAEEAAVNMMRTRGISTKLDYSRLGQVFDLSKRGPGSIYGGTSSVGSRSALASALGSEAGSEMGSDSEGESSSAAKNPANAAAASGTMAAEPSVAQSLANAFAKKTEGLGKSRPAAEEAADSEMGDNNDYEGASEMGHGQNEYNEDTYMEEDIDPFGGSYHGDSDEE